MIARALASSAHPILAHVIPTRRCNLACTYCNEFDDVSSPVPTEEMITRIDKLAELGTAAISLSGGEPMLHPDLEAIIRRIREHGMLSSLITNGYLLSRLKIDALNRAGLDQLQISVDNIEPDDVSKKSLKVLEKKLRLLADHAMFGVNINAVVGAEMREPGDAVAVARTAAELDLTYTVGILHDGSGQLAPLSGTARDAFDEITAMDTPFWLRARYNRFQKRLADGKPNDWHCGAGGRYLYICEDGLVHWCSQQRGTPGIPLAQYTRAHLAHQYRLPKPCASHCTVACVHQVAMIDYVREQPREALVQLLTREPETSTLDDLPFGFRVLARVFLPEPGRPPGLAARVGMRLLGVDRSAQSATDRIHCL